MAQDSHMGNARRGWHSGDVPGTRRAEQAPKANLSCSRDGAKESCWCIIRWTLARPRDSGEGQKGSALPRTQHGKRREGARGGKALLCQILRALLVPLPPLGTAGWQVQRSAGQTRSWEGRWPRGHAAKALGLGATALSSASIMCHSCFGMSHAICLCQHSAPSHPAPHPCPPQLCHLH